MQRVIDKHKEEWYREDGKPLYNTGVTVSMSEIPDDADLANLKVSTWNVLYDSCHIKVEGIDDRHNILIIEIPSWMQTVLYTADARGRQHCEDLLHKLNYESGMVKNKQKIPYDNTVV